MSTIKLFPFSTSQYWPEVRKATNIKPITDKTILAIYQKYFSDQSNFQFANYHSVDELLARMNTAANELPPVANKHHFKAQFFRGVLTSNNALDWQEQVKQFRKHFTIQYSPLMLKETVEGYTTLSNEEWFCFTFHDYLNTYPLFSRKEVIDLMEHFLNGKIKEYSNKTLLTVGEVKMVNAYQRYLNFLTQNVINMIRYTKRQYAEILKVGEGEFDIEIKDIEKETPFVSNYLSLALNDIELGELEGFLDYQANNNQYLYMFLWLLDESLITGSKSFDSAKTDLIFLWMEKKTPFSRLYKKEADLLFSEGAGFHKVEHERKWLQRIREFVNGKKVQEGMTFLNYGKQMLQQGYDIHMLNCTNKHNCSTNMTYEKKIEECERLLYVIESQQKTGAETKASKPINRMQWLGTQKELAELFVELKQRGWIENIEQAAIKSAFTNSNTIQQVLKPGMNKKTKESEYDQIYTPAYSPSFHNILENIKSVID